VAREIFAPIGIHRAPTVRTRESGGQDGLVWCNAGYYPTLDDLAKIAMLYQARGAHGGVQILNRELTAQLLSAHGAIVKNADDLWKIITFIRAHYDGDPDYKFGTPKSQQ